VLLNNALVLLFTAVTDALGITAPEESVTKPVSDPVMMPWALDDAGLKRYRNKPRLRSDGAKHFLTRPANCHLQK
jgi:hypothetical protein